MTTQHGLTLSTVARIQQVLADFLEVEQGVLFGSRAKGTQKPGSDIDLALVGSNLDWRTVGRIHSALDDLPIPYRFSLVIFGEKLDRDVAAHIRRVGIPIFEREPVVAR